jgi:magnesium chelatase family protein
MSHEVTVHTCLVAGASGFISPIKAVQSNANPPDKEAERYLRLWYGLKTASPGLRKGEVDCISLEMPGHFPHPPSEADLACLLGIAAHLDLVPPGLDFSPFVFMGQVGLAGTIYPVRGVYPAARAAVEGQYLVMMVPQENLAHALGVPGIRVIGVDSVQEVIEFFCSKRSLMVYPDETLVPYSELDLATPVPVVEGPDSCVQSYSVDMSEVFGQSHAVRAAEIAAAGGHSLLFSGPPGSGRTMIAHRIRTILPFMSEKEREEVTSIQSAAGMLTYFYRPECLRPFRAPHHTVSRKALTPGGNTDYGEATLAHNGVLLVDQAHEWDVDLLNLVCAMQRKNGDARLGPVVTRIYSNYLLVGAVCLCRCEHDECVCDTEVKLEHQRHMRRHVLPCFDMYANVLRLRERRLYSRQAPTSASLREKVTVARAEQAERYAGLRYTTNASVRGEELLKLGAVDPSLLSELEEAVKTLPTPGGDRGATAVLRIARTIADLEGEEMVLQSHVDEAIEYSVFNPF